MKKGLVGFWNCIYFFKIKKKMKTNHSSLKFKLIVKTTNQDQTFKRVGAM